MQATKKKSMIEKLQSILNNRQSKRIKFSCSGSITVDLFTASAIVAVYNSVGDANKAKIENMLSTKAGIFKMSDIAFKLVNKKS